jgi:NAD-reducing hydrogenase small subunit
MTKVKVATLWLDGCSGCHMSLFDLDERLLDLAEQVDFVYTPLVDQKDFPEGVDITLVEGAVSYDEDLKKMEKVRARTRILVSFGDCAVAGNVPAKRNPFDTAEVMEHSFIDLSTVQQQIPAESVPRLLPYVRPLHEIVDVDLYIQGCPPSADLIFYVLSELVAGRTPDLTEKMRPGA